MSKEKVSAAVAVVNPQEISAPKTREEVPQVIEQLKQQLKALKGENDEKLSTDVVYNNTNISKVTKVSELVEISSSVRKRAAAYAEEIVNLGLGEMNIKPFSVSGLTPTQFEAVVKKAVHELVNKSRIAKLESAISKLSNHLDAETKLQNELKDIVEFSQKDIE